MRSANSNSDWEICFCPHGPRPHEAGTMRIERTLGWNRCGSWGEFSPPRSSIFKSYMAAKRATAGSARPTVKQSPLDRQRAGGFRDVKKLAFADAVGCGGHSFRKTPAVLSGDLRRPPVAAIMMP